MKKMRMISLAVVAGIWFALVLGAWFGPRQEMSESERRKLAQFPDVTLESILGGKFMTGFEDFTLDQFPLRDTFRQLKALFHYNVLQQGDNNGIYVVDGYAAKLEYPLKAGSVNHALEKFQKIYETYLGDSERIVMTVVPDKGYYLAEENGYLKMDYERLFSMVAEGMPLKLS